MSGPERLGNGPYGTPGPGSIVVNKFGRNGDIDTGTTPEDVWSEGGLYPFPAAPVSLEILSGSANDAAAGSGARTVEVEGLDSNYDSLKETVALNGVTPVNLVNQFARVFRLIVVTAGASAKNEGKITVRDQGAGTTRAVIDFDAALGGGAGQSLMAVYTLPAGKKGLIRRHWARLDKFPGTDAQGRIVVRPFGGAWQTKETFSFNQDNVHDIEYPDNTGIEITEKTDVRMEIFSVGANDVAIDAGFDITASDI